MFSRLETAVQCLAEKIAKEQNREIHYIDVSTMTSRKVLNTIRKIQKQITNKELYVV